MFGEWGLKAEASSRTGLRSAGATVFPGRKDLHLPWLEVSTTVTLPVACAPPRGIGEKKQAEEQDDGGCRRMPEAYALYFMKNAIDFSIMVPPGSPLVVKVGGSLFSEAKSVIAILMGSRRPLLVVPGGGPFARIIRFIQLPDDTAHWMATLAMDQFGWYLAAKGLPVTNELTVPRRVEILLPYRVMHERDPLPHSWDITSDTIAAWVASELGLDLLLLKSVDGITRDGILLSRVTEPFPCQEVDPYLVRFTVAHGVRTTVLNGRVEGRVWDFLAGRDVVRTVIEPRI